MAAVCHAPTAPLMQAVGNHGYGCLRASEDFSLPLSRKGGSCAGSPIYTPASFDDCRSFSLYSELHSPHGELPLLGEEPPWMELWEGGSSPSSHGGHGGDLADDNILLPRSDVGDVPAPATDLNAYTSGALAPPSFYEGPNTPPLKALEGKASPVALIRRLEAEQSIREARVQAVYDSALGWLLDPFTRVEEEGDSDIDLAYSEGLPAWARIGEGEGDTCEGGGVEVEEDDEEWEWRAEQISLSGSGIVTEEEEVERRSGESERVGERLCFGNALAAEVVGEVGKRKRGRPRGTGGNRRKASQRGGRRVKGSGVRGEIVEKRNGTLPLLKRRRGMDVVEEAEEVMKEAEGVEGGVPECKEGEEVKKLSVRVRRKVRKLEEEVWNPHGGSGSEGEGEGRRGGGCGAGRSLGVAVRKRASSVTSVKQAGRQLMNRGRGVEGVGGTIALVRSQGSVTRVSTVGESVQPQKRKRGRPPKHPKVDMAAALLEEREAMAVEGSDQATDGEKVERTGSLSAASSLTEGLLSEENQAGSSPSTPRTRPSR